MAIRGEPLDAPTDQDLDAVLRRLREAEVADTDLLQILDIAIRMARADMGTLQRFDDTADCLKLVASRGFSPEALTFFDVVRRDTNSTCAIALSRRMRVFVGDISESYLFVGTPELDVLRASGVSAVQSTPIISGSGRFCGVVSTHYRTPQIESSINHAPVDHLALRVADILAQRNNPTSRLSIHGQVTADFEPGG
jgi:GAF domain-containing protein